MGLSLKTYSAKDWILRVDLDNILSSVTVTSIHPYSQEANQLLHVAVNAYIPVVTPLRISQGMCDVLFCFFFPFKQDASHSLVKRHFLSSFSRGHEHSFIWITKIVCSILFLLEFAIRKKHFVKLLELFSPSFI